MPAGYAAERRHDGFAEAPASAPPAEAMLLKRWRRQRAAAPAEVLMAALRAERGSAAKQPAPEARCCSLRQRQRRLAYCGLAASPAPRQPEAAAALSLLREFLRSLASELAARLAFSFRGWRRAPRRGGEDAAARLRCVAPVIRLRFAVIVVAAAVTGQSRQWCRRRLLASHYWNNISPADTPTHFHIDTVIASLNTPNIRDD